MLVSEGFTNVLPVQVNDQIATCNGGACGNQPRPRPDPIGGANSPAQQRMESQEFFLQAEMMSDIKMVTDLANRYNCAIYSLDPRGLAPFEFDLSTAGQAAVSLTRNQQMLDTTIDTLRVLADETDGRAIVNSNDLDRGLRQIIRDTSAYYLLGYTSAVTTDGKFHKLNVRVKRPGLQVRSRPGYMAMSAAEVERAIAPKKPGPPPAITEALGTLAVSAQQRRNPIRTWLGMSPGSDGKTKITFVWNPTPAVPGARREPWPPAFRCSREARTRICYHREKAIRPGRVEFEVPPGPIELEIGAQDAAGEVLDRETRKLVVPSLGLGLTVSTPEVFRGRTLPEWQTLCDRSPGASGHRARVPPHRSASRSRRCAERRRHTRALTARMLNREGGEMSTCQSTPAGFGGLSQIDVPLAALPPGEFLIEVIAKDGAEQTSALVAFRVTP